MKIVIVLENIDKTITIDRKFLKRFSDYVIESTKNQNLYYVVTIPYHQLHLVLRDKESFSEFSIRKDYLTNQIDGWINLTDWNIKNQFGISLIETHIKNDTTISLELDERSNRLLSEPLYSWDVINNVEMLPNKIEHLIHYDFVVYSQRSIIDKIRIAYPSELTEIMQVIDFTADYISNTGLMEFDRIRFIKDFLSQDNNKMYYNRESLIQLLNTLFEFGVCRIRSVEDSSSIIINNESFWFGHILLSCKNAESLERILRCIRKLKSIDLTEKFIIVSVQMIEERFSNNNLLYFTQQLINDGQLRTLIRNGLHFHGSVQHQLLLNIEEINLSNVKKPMLFDCINFVANANELETSIQLKTRILFNFIPRAKDLELKLQIQYEFEKVIGSISNLDLLWDIIKELLSLSVYDISDYLAHLCSKKYEQLTFATIKNAEDNSDLYLLSIFNAIMSMMEQKEFHDLVEQAHTKANKFKARKRSFFESFLFKLFSSLITDYKFAVQKTLLEINWYLFEQFRGNQSLKKIFRAPIAANYGDLYRRNSYDSIIVQGYIDALDSFIEDSNSEMKIIAFHFIIDSVRDVEMNKIDGVFKSYLKKIKDDKAIIGFTKDWKNFFDFNGIE